MRNFSLKNFNRYDFVATAIIIIFAVLWQHGWHDMHAQSNGKMPAMALSLKSLAYGLLRTNMRLLIGLFWSFVFSFIAAVWAAKSKHAAHFILPFINFMESVPLVGFMSFSIVFFIHLYPHSVMGLECAAIFGVFTGQVWNMALSMYQSIIIVPNDLLDVAASFKLTAWQKFWKIEFPYTIPGLLWNTMVSQSAAWFALVGTETIVIGARNYVLPGVGSYIQAGLNTANIGAIILAIGAIVLNIILFDQLLFIPLVRWSEKFKFACTKSRNSNTSWAYDVYRKASILQLISSTLRKAYVYSYYWIRKLKPNCSNKIPVKYISAARIVLLTAWYICLTFCALYYGSKFLNALPPIDASHMAYLICLTTLRVFAAMLLSLIIFLPLGIWIGLNPRLTKWLQPVIQILAALPPDILYPIMAILLISYHAQLGLWTIPLIMLGTQWYILFNVISGVSSIPQDILDVGTIFSIKGWKNWRKIIIPAILPSVVTGIISAAGGAWNADIVAEVIQWGSQTLQSNGLGAFIAIQTTLNHPNKEALGCLLMCGLVALCMIFVWRPLYRMVDRRYKIN